MKKYLLVATMFALAAGPAQAGDLGWESTGSLTIRVTILPLGAALSAAQAGATGLWSMGSNGRGLMIDGPREIESGETRELALLAAQTGALTVRSLSRGLRVSRASATADRGLSRQAFQIRTNDVDPIDNTPKVLVIATL